jgi:cytochrome P450
MVHGPCCGDSIRRRACRLRDLPRVTGSDVVFDPFSDEYFDDPYEIYKRLRDEAPVYFNERYGFYALSRYADVASAHLDWETFSSSHGTDLATMSGDPQMVAEMASIIMLDPPAHDRLRVLVSRVFTPRATAGVEPMVRRVIGEHLDAIGDRREFDAVAELSALFPVEIISEMLGVAPSDRQQIRQWLDAALHREHGEMLPNAAGEQAYVAMGTYFYELAVAKRADPGDDLLSRLTTVSVDRGDGATTRLSDIEIAGFAALLGGAGAETVTKLVGNAFVLFHRHPDQWQTIVADPSQAAGAVEEILRLLPPSQYQGRFSVRDSSSYGETIPAGFPVLLLTGAANRDERQYLEPDRFDIERQVGHALGFGFGIHSCLGAALARLESRVIIEEMARRWPCYEVDEAGLKRVHMANVAGYANVPVTVLP